MLQIEFSTAKFAPYLPEDCQANPGAYGFELAHWLSVKLADQGVMTSYPLGEDWGWFIEYIQDDVEITIGCSSQALEGEGYSGNPIGWSIFIKPHLSLKQRLKRASPDAQIERLAQSIVAVLEAEGIQVKQC